MSERRILDHGNVFPARDFLDLGGEQVASLGDDDGRGHIGAVLERDGVFGGIGDDHGGALGVLEHAAPAHLALQTADAAFDDGIAFRLLVFVFHFLAAHLQFARKVLPLEQIIENRPDEEDESGFPGDFEDQAGGIAEHAAGGARGERHQQKPVAPQAADGEVGYGDGRKQGLHQSAQCGDGEKLFQLGGGADAGGVGQERCGSEDQAALSECGRERNDPSQSQSGARGDEESGVCEEGSQRLHAQVAGNGALQAVMEKAAPGEGEARHQGEQNKGRGHARSGADKIAAAGDLSFFAGLLAPSRGCLFGLVGFCHRSVASWSVCQSVGWPERADFHLLERV